MSIEQVNSNPAHIDKQSAEQLRLKKAAGEFEAMFISQMFRIMRESEKVMKEGEEGEGLGLGTNNPYQDLFDWQLSVKLSERSPLGIASEMMRHYQNQVGGSGHSDRTVTPAPQPKAAPAPSSPPAHRAEKPLHIPKMPQSLEAIIGKAAEAHGVDPDLIRAVIATESAGNPRAVSPKGAKGLMQLIDSTAAEVGVRNPFDPSQNVHGGAAYLKRMLDRYNGDQALALAAYNAGPGAVDKYGGVPPYPETRSYVRKIMQHLENKPVTAPLAKPGEESQ